MKTAELFNVKGYGVIVTGGASGLGLAFGEALADQRRALHDVRRRPIAHRQRSEAPEGPPAATCAA